jgi:hypothetical protein
VKSISLLVVFILLAYSVQSQLRNPDSLALNQAILSAKQKYEIALSDNSHVYNGTEYVSSVKQKKIVGDPYYFDYDWQQGVVHYDGQRYDHVPLRYDIFEDKLLIEYSQGYESIELIPEKIRYFEINEHTFIHLSNTEAESTIKGGFFDLLFDGHVNVYAKRYKVIKEIKDQGIMVVEYVDKNKLLLMKNEQYFVINNKRDLLNAFRDRKTEIKRYLANKGPFKANPETTLIAAASYYEQLSK